MKEQEIIFNLDTLDSNFRIRFGGILSENYSDYLTPSRSVSQLLVGGFSALANTNNKIIYISFTINFDKEDAIKANYQGRFIKNGKLLPISKDTKFEEILDLFGETLYDFDDGVEQTAVFSRPELNANIEFSWIIGETMESEKKLSVIIIESTLENDKSALYE